MIDKINNDEKAFPIIVSSVDEMGISVEFGASLLDENQEPDLDKVVILKPDSFYNTKDYGKPPKSVDGFVIVKDDDGYHFYIAELKSSKKQNITRKDIQEKFDTIFRQFIAEDFSHIFLGEYSLLKLNLWLVCDPMNLRSGNPTREELIEKVKAAKRLRGMMADLVVGFRVYSFKGVSAAIVPMLSPPVIEQKYFEDLVSDIA